MQILQKIFSLLDHETLKLMWKFLIRDPHTDICDCLDDTTVVLLVKVHYNPDLVEQTPWLLPDSRDNRYHR